MPISGLERLPEKSHRASVCFQEGLWRPRCPSISWKRIPGLDYIILKVLFLVFNWNLYYYRFCLFFFLLAKRSHNTSWSNFWFVSCPIQLISRSVFCNHHLHMTLLLWIAVSTPRTPRPTFKSFSSILRVLPSNIPSSYSLISQYTETGTFCSIKLISFACHKHKMLFLTSDLFLWLSLEEKVSFF